MKDIHKCTICGYIYNAANGDPIAGVREGTPFSEIPASWTCPLCGASVDEFELLDE